MTAVEFLLQTFKLTNVDLSHHKLIIEQVKEMEKQKKDDFAIGFAEWVNEEYIHYHGDGEYYDHVENRWYKLEELLEIYKKEKGL